jgi:eukaryotic translation initiation factor 2C
MPLVDVGGARSNLLPAEVCQILPGQPFRGKLTDEHTAQMILHACKPPAANARAIVSQGLSSLGFATTEQPLGGFGVRISGQMAVVPARVLPAPRVMYAQKSQEIDARASWNLRSVKFSQGATLGQWAVLCIRDGNAKSEFGGGIRDPELIKVLGGFKKMMSVSGMTVRGEPRIAEAVLPPKVRCVPRLS